MEENNIGMLIEQIIKERRLKKKDVATLLGIDVKTLYNYTHGVVPIPKTKLKIMENFINGKTSDDDINAVENYGKEINNIGEGSPYYDVDFMGGFDLMVNNQTTIPDGYVSLPAFNKQGVMWVNVTGHSMEPAINHGDIIAIKELQDWQTYLPKGEIYGIVTKNDLRTVKIVRKGSDEQHIRLVPVNISEYDEEEIPLSSIMKVFVVLANIKRF